MKLLVILIIAVAVIVAFPIGHAFEAVFNTQEDDD